MRGLLSLRDVNGCATVRDLEVEGLADFHLCSDERGDELHLARVLNTADFRYYTVLLYNTIKSIAN